MMFSCLAPFVTHDPLIQAIPTTRAPTRVALVGTSGPGCVSLWDTHTDEQGDEVTSLTGSVASFAGSMGLLKVRFDAGGQHMIALDSSGSLSLWSTKLWVMLQKWNDVGAVDMEIVPDPSDQGHITVAVTCETASGAEITIRHLPTFVEVCRFPAPHGAVLGTARDNQGRVLLLERPRADAAEYHLQCLRPSVPTHRLQELLKAHRFEDAASLCQEHSLSAELYLRPLAEHRLHLLKKGEATLEEALEVLRKLEDQEYAAELCLHSAAPSEPTQARRLLEEAATIASTHGFKEVAKEAASLLRRFSTYQQLGAEPFDGNDWTWFRDVPLREAMFTHLQAGDLQGARVIWRRHATGEENLADGFEEIMAGVPPTMRPEDVLAWLAEEVVPSLDADTLMRLAEWVESQARLLEQSTAGLLHVAARCGHLLDTPMESMGLVMSPSLQRLQRELDDLCYLDASHAVRFPLAEYSTLTHVDVALRLLDRVPTADMLGDEIEHHFRPYLERHNEEAEAVLGEYALEMVEEGTAYEDRAVASLRAVRNPAERARILLEVAGELTDSQSSELAALMADTLAGGAKAELSTTTEGAALASQLHQQHKLLELRQLVHRYGIRRYEVADPQQATALLHHILSQTDCPGALSDAERIAEFYSHLSPHAARVEQMQNYISEGNVAAALASFEAMPCDQADPVARDVLSGLLSDLGSEESEASQTKTAEAAIALATALLERQGGAGDETTGDAAGDDEILTESVAAMLAGLVTVQHLQRSGMFIGLRSLVSPSLREDALRSFVSSLGARNAEEGKDAMDRSPSLGAVLSLADHLGMARPTALRVVAMEASTSPWHTLALDACERLVARELTALTARTCCFVVASLLRQFHEVTDSWSHGEHGNTACSVREVLALPQAMSRLLGSALILSGDENLAECLKLLGECESAEALLAQCDMAELLPAPAEEEEEQEAGSLSEPRPEWRSDLSHYKEDSTVLVPGEALAALAAAHAEVEELEIKCLDGRMFARLARMEEDEDEEDEDQPRTVAGPQTEALLALLQRNGANQLALRLAARSSTTMSMVAPWEGSKAVVEASIGALVHKTLRARRVDGALAVGYILESNAEAPLAPVLQLLAHATPNWKRASSLATVGYETATLDGDAANAGGFRGFQKRARLLAGLGDGGMSFDGVTLRRFFTLEPPDSSDIDTAMGMVVALLEASNSDLDVAYSFGEAFSLELGQVRQKYVEYHMTSSTSDFKERILQVVDHMEPTTLVELVRDMLLTKISPYDYARLSFAVRILRHCDPSLTTLCKRHSAILDLLAGYRRTIPADAEELAGSASTAWAAEKWSGERLPFVALIQDPERVVEPELGLDSMDRLKPVAHCLDLDMDRLHVKLAERLAAEAAAPGDVAAAIKGVKEPTLRLATAERLALASNSAGTKVAGLTFALSLAREWKESFGEDEQESDGFLEAQANAERFATAVADAKTQLLLGEAGKEHLVGGGAVDAGEILYRLCDEHEPRNPSQPDVVDMGLHRLFDQVATLHGLEPDETRHRIIKRWLHKRASISEPEKVQATPSRTPSRRGSCLADQSTAGEVKAVAEEGAVRRIVFMMARGDVTADARMLYVYAHSNDVTVSTRARAWALKSLLVAASAEVGGLTVEALPCPVEELLERLTHLRHVELLEELQIAVTLEELGTCSKPGLVRSLWKENGSEPGVAKLVCEMCLEYGVSDTSLWGEVLAKLNANGEVPFLLRALKRILQLPCAAKIPKLAQIWQSTTAAPLAALQSHEGALSATAQKTLSLAVDLACSGPLDPMPDMRPAVDLLLQAEQGELAIRCMLVITDSVQRREALAMLLDAGMGLPVKALHQLPPYETQPKGAVRGLQGMTREVYDHMDAKGAHLEMYDCSLGHQRAFLAHILHKGDISNALKSLVAASRFEEAFGLVAAKQGTMGEAAGLLPEQKIDQLHDYLTAVGCAAEAEQVSTAQMA